MSLFMTHRYSNQMLKCPVRYEWCYMPLPMRRTPTLPRNLWDVIPDGRAINVAQGIIRARYRDSWEEPTFLTPEKIYKYTIDLWSTSNRFLKNHRIRVEVSSSNFPQFDRNPNTGQPFGLDSDIQMANQTIYHDAEHPSHILLPIVPID